MNIVMETASAGITRGWTFMFAGLQQLAKGFFCKIEERKTARILDELARLDEGALNDMGLTWSDLTPKGFFAEAARRSRQQTMIDAGTVAR